MRLCCGDLAPQSQAACLCHYIYSAPSRCACLQDTCNISLDLLSTSSLSRLLDNGLHKQEHPCWGGITRGNRCLPCRKHCQSGSGTPEPSEEVPVAPVEAPVANQPLTSEEIIRIVQAAFEECSRTTRFDTVPPAPIRYFGMNIHGPGLGGAPEVDVQNRAPEVDVLNRAAPAIATAGPSQVEPPRTLGNASGRRVTVSPPISSRRRVRVSDQPTTVQAEKLHKMVYRTLICLKDILQLSLVSFLRPKPQGSLDQVIQKAPPMCMTVLPKKITIPKFTSISSLNILTGQSLKSLTPG